MKKNKFAERLKFLRITAGMTQSELGKALKVARQTISLYENGERECSFDMLMSIADYFGTTVCFLIGRTDEYNYPQIKETKAQFPPR